jgi:hypothetical protein
MFDLIRTSAVSSHQMMSASKGALRLPPMEMVEILVYIADHNKIFGDAARLTLAGWDEASAKQIATDPSAPAEILNYWLSPKNSRPALTPLLLENPAVTNTRLSELAGSANKQLIDFFIASPRIRKTPQILQELATNQNLSGFQVARVKALIEGKPEPVEADLAVPAPEQKPVEKDDSEAILESVTPEQAESEPKPEILTPDSAPEDILSDDPETQTAVNTFMTEHAKEIAAEPEKPFHAIGGLHEDILLVEDTPPAPVAAAAAAAAGAAPAPAPKPAHKLLAKPEHDKRDSVLQKINKLDIKGRIQLAMKGTKEERSILVRDGTKIVAIAVLESPKITDGEVEKFASQKNVLEAVLRTIPMKRRFAKNYAVVRNLVFNPRTPLDVSLGLMKNLLVADLRNLSGNKEVSDTVRKLALRMFKQKNEAANKN